jgi:hypothetical protein
MGTGSLFTQLPRRSVLRSLPKLNSKKPMLIPLKSKPKACYEVSRLVS